MEKKVNGNFLGILILLSVLLISCSRESESRVTLVSGVLSWARQDWSSAAASFIRVVESSQNDDTSLLRDYALFGLASTYLAQEEYDSALVRLAEISPETPDEIRSSLWYQIGIAAYRKGLYDKACTYFRKTLEIDPDAMDAKVNLELCRRSMISNESVEAAASPEVGEDGQTDEQSEILFNLVRRKEQERWKNRQDETNPEVEDY